jgi:hypothetical protein
MGGMFGGGGGGGGSAPIDYGSGAPGVGYTNPRDSVGDPYVSSYAPQTATPFLQSVMSQQSSSPLQQGNSLGLPSLQSMFGMQQKGAPFQASGIQQLAPMAPYMGSTYRPDMSGAMARLNNAAPFVRPEQVSELDNQGRPIVKDTLVNDNPVSQVVSDAGGGG